MLNKHPINAVDFSYYYVKQSSNIIHPKQFRRFINVIKLKQKKRQETIHENYKPGNIINEIKQLVVVVVIHIILEETLRNVSVQN